MSEYTIQEKSMKYSCQEHCATRANARVKNKPKQHLYIFYTMS